MLQQQQQPFHMQSQEQIYQSQQPQQSIYQAQQQSMHVQQSYQAHTAVPFQIQHGYTVVHDNVQQQQQQQQPATIQHYASGHQQAAHQMGQAPGQQHEPAHPQKQGLLPTPLRSSVQDQGQRQGGHSQQYVAMEERPGQIDRIKDKRGQVREALWESDTH